VSVCPVDPLAEHSPTTQGFELMPKLAGVAYISVVQYGSIHEYQCGE
jgi:hypothetical protein